MAAILFSSVMLLLGLIAVLLAFEVLGNPKGSSDKSRLLAVHRIMGYLFILSFFILFVGMLGRFKWANSFSVRTDIHVSLAIAAFVLLIVKWSVARRYKKFATYFFPLGISLMALCFVFVGIMAGGFIGGKAASFSVTKSDKLVTETPSTDGFPDKVLIEEKKFVQLCGACHPIGQVIYPLRNETKADQWAGIVKRMQEKTDKISDEDAKMIVDYLKQFYP